MGIGKKLKKQWKNVHRFLKEERNIGARKKNFDDIKFEVLVKAIQYLPNKEKLYEKLIELITPYYMELDNEMDRRKLKSDLEFIAIRKLLSDLDINLFLLTIGKKVW